MTAKKSPWVYLYRLTSKGLVFFDYGIRGMEEVYGRRGFVVAYTRIHG
jgi:hypothetical protein